LALRFFFYDRVEPQSYKLQADALDAVFQFIHVFVAVWILFAAVLFFALS
jgi:hypothetical protein